MIASFQHKGLKRLFHKGNARYVASGLRARVARILFILDAAGSLADLDIPGIGLHELSGNLKGIWSVTVSGNWRITFRFADGNAHDVDLVDYH